MKFCNTALSRFLQRMFVASCCRWHQMAPLNPDFNCEKLQYQRVFKLTTNYCSSESIVCPILSIPYSFHQNWRKKLKEWRFYWLYTWFDKKEDEPPLPTGTVNFLWAKSTGWNCYPSISCARMCLRLLWPDLAATNDARLKKICNFKQKWRKIQENLQKESIFCQTFAS